VATVLIGVNQLGTLLSVVIIDVVLAGDNAIVVGMAAAGLPAERRRRIIVLGIAAATVLRILFAYFAVQLLAVIGLTLAGGVLLLWVSWKMYREIRETHTNKPPELGGVERWARELSTRLPALRPEGYEVARPPAALAHRAGHAWEQLVLPVSARRARWLLCPANLAPLAHPRNAVVIHDATLERVQGRPERVVDLTADELVAFGVPRLADVFTALPAGAFVDVELKEAVVAPTLSVIAAARGPIARMALTVSSSTSAAPRSISPTKCCVGSTTGNQGQR